jgi:hypothetical protein
MPAPGRDLHAPPDPVQQHLVPSPVPALTSPYGWCILAAALPRLPRLSPSRSVRFTNRFTEPVLDLPAPGPSIRASMPTPSPLPQWLPFPGRWLRSSLMRPAVRSVVLGVDQDRLGFGLARLRELFG